jgi:hypothetical protein
LENRPVKSWKGVVAVGVALTLAFAFAQWFVRRFEVLVLRELKMVEDARTERVLRLAGLHAYEERNAAYMDAVRGRVR